VFRVGCNVCGQDVPLTVLKQHAALFLCYVARNGSGSSRPTAELYTVTTISPERAPCWLCEALHDASLQPAVCLVFEARGVSRFCVEEH